MLLVNTIQLFFFNSTFSPACLLTTVGQPLLKVSIQEAGIIYILPISQSAGILLYLFTLFSLVLL